MDSGTFLTFDLDWAPEFVLEDVQKLLKNIGCSMTVFATHVSDEVTRWLESPRVETAIHPNLVQVADEKEQLSKWMTWSPKAKGVRNHRLYYHSGLLKMYQDAGLEYLSNDL